ncbi:MAG TPA: hypothetical protein VHN15_10895 [Thermoanaerobaculia bacterium]|nr:hypothetical protein [Thermoanaerobaculia bacterium]
MQASNSTPAEVRVTVENGGGTRGGGKKPSRKLLGVDVDQSIALAPYSYRLSATEAKGEVHFYVQERGEWTHAASAAFNDPNALVTLVGSSGKYRVEVTYPQVA